MFSTALIPFIGIGLIAQSIDGALGMAYGVTSSTLLLGLGMAPALASASVHMAELATTGVSGLSHGFFGNVDKHLLLRLALPGAIGGMVGAFVLSHLQTPWLGAVVAAYLLVLGVSLVLRAWRNRTPDAALKPRRTKRLALAAGFLDAVGGGGWGPMTSTSLIAQNLPPRIAIGTANAAEFFVSLAISAVFLGTIGHVYGRAVLGLLLGGLIAAPFAAWLTRHLPARITTAAVGGLVSLLSVITLGRHLLA
ncbi:MAG: sulfite exporter TauE/SafE family protein [Rhodanobacteraceae bacterium]|mgnify:FL=1|nr:sulfite exporter TauE/SafE family protein [Rhodanobacteraceae bacterium]MBL0041937.1 sulfite exporter TauE/SafE family protein [Xanthomonadales bacterium]MBP6077805.1 sulfite exporter TauE/SafE family protein [Xanthomonadales bacterium]MBP7623604.1 sulfite exporter TauE/SafE family protein [Xanthomonadales bacterium]